MDQATAEKKLQREDYEADLYEIGKVIGDELKRQGIPFFHNIFLNVSGELLISAIESYTSYISPIRSANL